MYEDLKIHITSRMDFLRGPWVERKNNYEQALCEALAIERDGCRYWDAKWGEYTLELKKGTSIWLDLVRYSEVFLEKPELNKARSVVLFCIPNPEKQMIVEVLGVPTPDLIRGLKLIKEQATALLALRDHVPRQLNAQASLTVSDVKTIAAFSAGLLDGLL